jgi:hypothetical protein
MYFSKQCQNFEKCAVDVICTFSNSLLKVLPALQKVFFPIAKASKTLSWASLASGASLAVLKYTYVLRKIKAKNYDRSLLIDTI